MNKNFKDALKKNVNKLKFKKDNIDKINEIKV